MNVLLFILILNLFILNIYWDEDQQPTPQPVPSSFSNFAVESWELPARRHSYQHQHRDQR